MENSLQNGCYVSFKLNHHWRLKLCNSVELVTIDCDQCCEWWI